MILQSELELQLNKIYNEDCFETMARMPDDFVDLIVTSPPWNAKKDYGDYSDDNKPDFDEWLGKLCKEMERVVSTAVYVFMSQDHMWTVHNALSGFKQWLFYHRRNLGASLHIKNPWIKTITPIAMSIPKGKISMDSSHHGISTMDLITGVNPQSNFPNNLRVHPAQDPVEAYLPLIARTPCNVVYDPFMGSGTTAMTCLKLGKNWIGSEINPDYVTVAGNRINNHQAQETLFGVQEELDALVSD